MSCIRTELGHSLNGVTTRKVVYQDSANALCTCKYIALLNGIHFKHDLCKTQDYVLVEIKIKNTFISVFMTESHLEGRRMDFAL
jgi:hypothetical protein